MTGREESRFRDRTVARLVATGVAYVVYRLPGDDQLTAGILLGVGALVLSWNLIDRVLLPPEHRYSIMDRVAPVVGVILILAGITQL